MLSDAGRPLGNLPLDVEIEDIAPWDASASPRWNGQNEGAHPSFGRPHSLLV